MSVKDRVHSPIEEYFKALDDLTGGAKSKNVAITEEHERPPLWVFIYHDLLGPRSVTAFTYGLSSEHHPQWAKGKPELVISVHSDDERWALAMGFLAKELRGECAFSYGQILRFGDRIIPGSDMSAFMVFAPCVLDEQQRHIVLSDRTINIVQLYPIYEDEIDLIQSGGVETLFENQDYEPYSVKRRSVFKWS
jgi:hypothetical protein